MGIVVKFEIKSRSSFNLVSVYQQAVIDILYMKNVLKLEENIKQRKYSTVSLTKYISTILISVHSDIPGLPVSLKFKEMKIKQMKIIVDIFPYKFCSYLPFLLNV